MLNLPDPQVFCCFSRSVTGRQVRQSKEGEKERERERERERHLQGDGGGAAAQKPEGSLRVLRSGGNMVEPKGSASEATYCLHDLDQVT